MSTLANAVLRPVRTGNAFEETVERLLQAIHLGVTAPGERLPAGDGAVAPWNPVANTPWGAFSAAVGAGHVFVGGEFTRINGQPQPGFAQFALPPPPPSTMS